jgi:hypothetical protein
MRFDPEDRLIDGTARKAALRWMCGSDMWAPAASACRRC